MAAAQVTPRDFPAPPTPPEDGPRVCILDSGITSNHPLLRVNVGGDEALNTQVTFNGTAANVLYAGPQQTYPGLDQINVTIPQSSAGKGSVNITMAVGGGASNTVNITVQ